MKLTSVALHGLLLLACFRATLADAQHGTIQHIIVVVQENRTPDNLFQDPNLIAARDSHPMAV